jgi:hypothetical protein
MSGPSNRCRKEIQRRTLSTRAASMRSWRSEFRLMADTAVAHEHFQRRKYFWRDQKMKVRE